jgi:Arc/MetJ-type ribon-helix-helix transcriptional regulator
MKQFSITIEPGLIKEVDHLIKSEQLHNSRNDFIRDAIRSKIMEFRRAEFRKDVRKIRDTALARGWNGELLTREDKERIANDFLKEKGFVK